jgi:hypothetical protein
MAIIQIHHVGSHIKNGGDWRLFKIIFKTLALAAILSTFKMMFKFKVRFTITKV